MIFKLLQLCKFFLAQRTSYGKTDLSRTGRNLKNTITLYSRDSSHTGFLPQVSSHTGFLPQLSSHTGFLPQLSSHTGLLPLYTCHTRNPVWKESCMGGIPCGGEYCGRNPVGRNHVGRITWEESRGKNPVGRKTTTTDLEITPTKGV